MKEEQKYEVREAIEQAQSQLMRAVELLDTTDTDVEKPQPEMEPEKPEEPQKPLDPEEEQIKGEGDCYAGEDNSMTITVSELKEKYGTVEKLSKLFFDMVDEDADQDGKFAPRIEGTAEEYLGRENLIGSINAKYVVSKSGCRHTSRQRLYVVEDGSKETEGPSSPEREENEEPEPWKEPKEVDTYEIEIKDDGGDLTAQIQRQLDVIPDGTESRPVLVKFPAGRYWTEGDLENNPKGEKGIFNLTERKYMILEGNSKEEPTVFYTKRPAVPYGGKIGEGEYSRRRHFWFIRCEFLKVRNIKVEGSNLIPGSLLGTSPEYTPDFWKGGTETGSRAGAPAYEANWEFEHAFDFRDCKNVDIYDCQSNGTWGDGVYIGNSKDNPSDTVTVRNCHFRFTGRQGVGVANARNVLIENIHVDKGRRAGVDLEPFKDGFVENVTVRNCKLHVAQVPIAAYGRGWVDNIKIIGNEYSFGGFIKCSNSNEEEKRHRKNWLVKDNVRTNEHGSPSADVKFSRTDNITLEGNRFNVSKKQSKETIQFADCEGEIIVRNNDFLGGKYIVKRGTTSDIILEGNTPEQEII